MVGWSQRDAVWERGQIFSFPGETQSVWVQGDRTELLDAKVAWNSVRAGGVWGRRDLIWRKREWGLKKGTEFGGIGITWQGFDNGLLLLLGQTKPMQGALSMSTQKELLFLLFQGDYQTRTHRWSETTFLVRPRFFQKPIKSFLKRYSMKQRLFWDG